jgi:hypothetical protein
MAQYGDIKISDDLTATMRRCNTCKKLILIEEKHNGVSHTMAQIASHWDCLTPEQQAAAIKHYHITEIV